MALTFSPAEQALYNVSKQLGEAEIARIYAGGTVDAIMSHTHETIRNSMTRTGSPREIYAIAIGTAEGQVEAQTAVGDPIDPMLTNAIARFRSAMEALPADPVPAAPVVPTPPLVPPVVPPATPVTPPVVPPVNPVPPVGNTPARSPATGVPQVPPPAGNRPIIVQNPEPSTLPATVVPNFPNPEYNPAAYRVGLNPGGMRKLFLDRYMYKFRRDSAASPVTPA